MNQAQVVLCVSLSVIFSGFLDVWKTHLLVNYEMFSKILCCFAYILVAHGESFQMQCTHYQVPNDTLMKQSVVAFSVWHMSKVETCKHILSIITFLYFSSVASQ